MLDEGVASALLVGVIWVDMEAACCTGAGVGWIWLSEGDTGGVSAAALCGSDAGLAICKTTELFRQGSCFGMQIGPLCMEI